MRKIQFTELNMAEEDEAMEPDTEGQPEEIQTGHVVPKLQESETPTPVASCGLVRQGLTDTA